MRRNTVVMWGIVALAFVIAISGVIGAIATPEGDHPYNWSVAALGATALGTLALAIGTGALAWSTTDDVRATRALATVAQDERADAARPVVILAVKPRLEVVHSTSRTHTLDDPNGYVDLGVRNIGRGPALDVGIVVEWWPYPDLPERRTATVEVRPARISSLMPGEGRDVTLPAAILNTVFSAGVWAWEAHEAGMFRALIEFDDWNGTAQPAFGWMGEMRAVDA
jgi:hypothetical protein